MNSILIYVFYAILAIFALGAVGLGAFLYLSSRKEREAKAKAQKVPASETLAARISEQYAAEGQPAVSYGAGGQGGASPVVKKTRSVFTFAENDNESKINLQSNIGENNDQDIILDK